ncbi:hypothetical protein LJE82_10475 [bacterium BMS3Abin03]|nr:hypothetical protein [bacterium BMS3Abin03]
MSKPYLRFPVLFVFGSIIIFSFSCRNQNEQLTDEGLKIYYKGDAKIEVGGLFVGIEMHHSSPLLQRISFYYPVANSLDESADYWRRDTSFIMQLGLKIGNGEKQLLGLEPFQFDLTPYSVNFHKNDDEKSVDISYRFTKTKPAMVIRYAIKNEGNEEKSFEFYTDLETAIRTSHSYNFIDKAWTEYDKDNSIIYANFDDPQTQSAQIFVANVGEKPESFTSVSQLSGLVNPDNEWLTQNVFELRNDLLFKDNQGRPTAKFLYRKNLKPQETMTIIQVVGSCKQEEGKEIAVYLIKNYENDINSYEQSVLKKVYGEAGLTSGDTIIDQSIAWSKAILEANTHYLDGDFVPMPCPAEYNFYFTHDVLKTDLAAVNFDIARVKRDLGFIIKHANEDKIIPHAYYWKDSVYQTEFADHDNWNNFWFIIVSGSYLRHSGEIEFLRTLYPYIQKSLTQALMTKGDDDLMWSNRPDWWDIGHLYGSKSYMTILAIKAIREYLFISTMLEKNPDKLSDFENLANKMQQQLNVKLWDDNLKYFINYYEPGKIDEHYYIGSLLAAHYGLLNNTRLDELVSTAKEKLLDKKVGIYNAFPMDFKELSDYLNFVGNEAGDKFFYANGGIWPHGNAWFALALIADDKKDEAFTFIKNIMTIDGIMSGPNGQPAMYEVRNGNYTDPSLYGTVDKPQFLWAAGWYLYSLYHLFAINENEWNIQLDPYIPENQNQISLDLFNSGKLSKVTVQGKGNYIKKILYDGNELSTAVIPYDGKYDKIEVYAGIPDKPYLINTKSVLKSCQYNSDAKILSIDLKSFPGNKDEVIIESPTGISKVSINNKPFTELLNIESSEGINISTFDFTHNSNSTSIKVEFK